ncbi:asparagine synthase (glutamine-hydrolyzing) [Candidatus Arthromitus sp. SFB-rat-Yit]|uniref:asparagine synthase (glutamine-hydrolyzing) n=1 Tax=Candidatus Arthromitus sp. SFB-rat-Yit TaxID=1041504 RepID=UPI000227A6C7|nr:asparagine synthase (glutamine-hydrolyzing) [Candidatus Arthromitus sp. SFB-rat-Yit]BAK80644.1 asparagine synthase (glutamine-hydrolyzing) [Candidatus Arthromitus sp. SFB-rat-Yit]
MCGITGFSNFNKDITSEFNNIVMMNDSLYHRGPDEYDYYKHKNVVFGHRRLSIVDPDGGKQPMQRVVNFHKYTIVYNGEIYNTNEIRDDLIDKGYRFSTYSDTEVVLINYIHYKENCVSRLNGIFAFCIFDEDEKCLFIARDQLGVKPIFYSLKGGYLIFGSEMKSLLKHPKVSTDVYREGILDLLSLGPSRSPGEGIFRDIKEVPPAHYLCVYEDKVILKEYWNLESKEHNLTLEDTKEKLSVMLEKVIKNQMVSDRGIFSFLSGGIDSSLISAIVSKELREKGEILDTFTVDYVDYDKDFKGNEFEVTSDKYFVKLANESIKSNNRIITIKNEDLFYALERGLYASDIPSMADIDISLYLFCNVIKNYGTVGLSGECADEIFGGYPWYLNDEDLKLNNFPWNRFSNIRKELFNDKIKSLDFDSHVENRINETLKSVQFLDSDSEFDKKIRKMTTLNVKWFMVTLLNRKDRMSMANSLEIRVPFADRELVEFSYNIPAKFKFLNGREKGILREASRKFLPYSIIDRKKSPYPKTQSNIYRDLIMKELSRILDNKSNPIFEIIDEKSVRRLIESKGDSYTKPWFGQLMRGPQLMAYLIQINMWLKKYNINLYI